MTAPAQPDRQRQDANTVPPDEKTCGTCAYGEFTEPDADKFGGTCKYPLPKVLPLSVTYNGQTVYPHWRHCLCWVAKGGAK